VAINHPWLLHDHLEDLAGVEFRHGETERVKAAIIDVAAHDGASDREAMLAQLAGGLSTSSSASQRPSPPPRSGRRRRPRRRNHHLDSACRLASAVAFLN
jgi:hypothetical protein